MRKLERPAQPVGFSQVVQSADTQLAGAISQGKEAKYPGLWSKFKAEYSAAQHGKCAYCEGPVWGLQYGDVEHIQPKAEVHDLASSPADWGVEAPWASIAVGRQTTLTARPGYWWRAYKWDNYALSCQICNQQWKGNLFPVDGARVLGPSNSPPGAHLLLCPFDLEFNPSLHFSYGRLGEISGLTPEGRSTIATCGLDRASLRMARQPLACATHEYIDEIAHDISTRELLKILRNIARDGADARHFCGTVRTIFEQRTAWPWEKLNTLIGTLQQTASPTRSLCDC